MRQPETDQAGLAFMRMAKPFQHKRRGEFGCGSLEVGWRGSGDPARHGDPGLGQDRFRSGLIDKLAVGR